VQKSLFPKSFCLLYDYSKLCYYTISYISFRPPTNCFAFVSLSKSRTACIPPSRAE